MLKIIVRLKSDHHGKALRKLKSSMQQRGKNQQNEKAIYGMEKMFGNHVSTRVKSKTYKELTQIAAKINSLIKI